MEKLTSKSIYIFRNIQIANSHPFCAEVIDVTKITYRIKNEDNNITFRITIKDFERDFEILETLRDFPKHSIEIYNILDVKKKASFKNPPIHKIFTSINDKFRANICMNPLCFCNGNQQCCINKTGDV